MAVQRFSHVGICVSDLPSSLRFYCELLGFRELSALDVAGPHADRLLELQGVRLRAVYLERDGVRLELLAYGAPTVVGPPEPRPMNQLGLTHLSLRVGNLTELVERLRAHGVRILDGTRITIPLPGGAAVFVTDPDGTRVELVEIPGDPAALPA